ncbi:MAG: small ribosomal subunit Rsm22 family protein [Oligoflexia bacterium]|nr:small ribosomal subunit Rsm22 family protein [Oligoflexia bacterium]
MRVPDSLANAFGEPFERLIADFSAAQGLIPGGDSAGPLDLNESLHSKRFLSRTVVPHILKLSALFNRQEKEQSAALDPYWKESSNPAHLRAAYFLYFMPSNLFRAAAVWAELGRLGFRWPSAISTLKGIEFGAGPAPGACSTAIASKLGILDFPESGNWALIEQDKAMLELGSAWAQKWFAEQGRADWGVRPFHRKLSLSDGFLPRSAPRFNLWMMSFFLNELSESPAEIARALTNAWERHLEEEGVIVLIEPALKLQSRKLLEIRREILILREKKGLDWLQILLPCLGHQACGALASTDDWCHEEATWWRPPYFSQIDKLAGLDRKTLPFSYLVIAKSKRAREEILPGLGKQPDAARRYRLVSPSHKEGREQEFYLCGAEGKRRARYRGPEEQSEEEKKLERGDILVGTEIRGDSKSSRVENFENRV